LFSADDIGRALSDFTVSKGRAYQRNGAVRIEEIIDGGALITGQVQGSRSVPYQVSVQVGRVLQAGSNPLGRAVIAGACSCPVGFNCKHVAALLLQVLADRAVPAATPNSEKLISDEAARWLGEMESAERTGDDEYPPEIRQRLVYVLTGCPSAQGRLVFPEADSAI
jgi:uncharacterized Zn finger protein